MIGVFVNDKLRIVDKNCNFQEMIQEEVIRIVFSEDIKQAIVKNEAIAATDASVKDGIMASVWEIEDLYECMSKINSIRSKNWMKNTVLDA